MCWVRWKQSRRERKSDVIVALGWSTWMFRSPASRRREDREDVIVRSSDSSERKDECGFGGRYIRTAVIELGREKARCSKDEMGGRLRFSSVMDRDFL